MNYTAETEQKRLQDEAASSAERDDVMTESSFNSPTSPHSPSLNSFSKQPRESLKKIFDKLVLIYLEINFKKMKFFQF